MSGRERRLAIRRGAIGGLVATVPWIIGGIGWASHWNAYTNLVFSLGGGVLWFTLIATTMDRYQKGAR